MSEQETVAVLGAGGTMGQAMARNLLGAGHPVRAWNRSRDKAEPLGQDGAEIFDSAAEAAESALVFFDTSVSGTKAPAEDGTLVILASGPSELRERVEPVFAALGHKTMWAGEAGAGTRLKLAVNSWLLSVVEGAAETLALAEGLGLDPRLVLETIKDGPLDSAYLQMKGEAMIARSFEPSFALSLAAKDARLVAEAAEQHHLDLPLLATIRQRLGDGARSHGDEDLSATFLTSAPQS